MTLSEELSWRGFTNQTTYKSNTAIDSKDPITFYWGVDPSSDSMTIGNLATAMMVRHFIAYGHKAILLVGGATGMIGDPDGKNEERSLKTIADIDHNKRGIVHQYTQIFNGQDFTIVDNYDWFKGISYLEFLRDVGKHVPMRQMLGREFVQSRLGEAGTGISYAEFSYSLIQGYDFLHLYKEMGATLQVCGADQWGNSIAGVELIRRIASAEANIWSAPLIIDKVTGKKFGKSEGNAIWLDGAKTSPTQFYQFWINCDDTAVEDYLKIYTLLEQSDIAGIMAEFTEDRSLRTAQKRLAYEVTALVHGKAAAKEAAADADSLRLSSQPAAGRLAATMLSVKKSSNIVDALHAAGLVASKSEGRSVLAAGGVYINNQQIMGRDIFTTDDFVEGTAQLRRGKKLHNMCVIKLAE